MKITMNTHTHMDTPPHTDGHTNTHTLIYTLTRKCTYSHTWARTPEPMGTHTHTHMGESTYGHMKALPRTHLHTDMHSASKTLTTHRCTTASSIYIFL